VLLKRLCGPLFFFVMVSGVAWADTMQASMFTLQVPPQWHVRTNTSRELVMGGDRRVGSMSMPMLLVQFCSNDPSAAEAGLIPCAGSCDTTIREMVEKLGKSMHLEPLQRAEKTGGIIEYRTMAPNAPEKNDITGIALSCSARGQAFLTLVSDDQESAGQIFDDILRSLKWNAPAAVAAASASSGKAAGKASGKRRLHPPAK